eukprot:3390854-Rhodomonas_salina.3
MSILALPPLSSSRDAGRRGRRWTCAGERVGGDAGVAGRAARRGAVRPRRHRVPHLARPAVRARQRPPAARRAASARADRGSG